MTNANSWFRWMALAAIASWTSACTLGPDPQRPKTVVDNAPGFVHADPQTTLPQAAPPQDTALQEAALQKITDAADDELPPWWLSFGDQATAALVEQALLQNTDLQVAAARVLEAQAALGNARSGLWPELSFGAGVNRSKNSFVLPQIGRVSTLSTTYSDNFSVSYQADVFGRLRRGRQAAWAELLAEQAARETVLHTVVAEVVRARVQLSTLDRSLANSVGIRDSWQDTLRTVERRQRSGLASALDLRLARENLAAAEAVVVDQEGRIQQARLALDMLLGVRPGTGEPVAGTLPELPDLGPVPAALPAALLDRRPDLRQAEMRLFAATAQIGVALADLFPSLSLTGSVGSQSDSLGDLVSSDAVIYNTILNLLAPLWDGGRRRAQVNAAKARTEQAAASYSGAILRALREVEDALVRERTNRRRLALLETRLEEALAADRIARERYRQGVVNLLQVLETERRRRAAEDALTAAHANLWNVRIDLHLALGGDWSPTQTTDQVAKNEAPVTHAEVKR